MVGTRSFYLVTPFIRLLQDWISFKKAGKFWHPARGDRSNAQSKRSETPQKKDQTPGKKEGSGELLTVVLLGLVCQSSAR